MDRLRPKGRKTMKTHDYLGPRRAGGRPLFWVSLSIVLGSMLFGLRCGGPELDLKDVPGLLVKKMETLSQMRISLLKSVDAEKMAVMAVTDKASQDFADQSLQAAQAVNHDRQVFGRLVEKDSTAQEMKVLREFDACWTEFQKIDQVLLKFAVGNSNIKAAQLSFSQGNEAITRFEKALMDVIPSHPSADKDSRLMGLAYTAITAGLKIHYLHAPHIAAANDNQMDKIEADIRQYEGEIKKSLTLLTPLVPEKNQAAIREAKKAYDQLTALTSKVIELSRQNDNIKSFELSLGRKRKVTAQCDEILISLQEAVRSRTFKATR